MRSVVFPSKHWIAIRKLASIRKFTEQPFRLALACNFFFISGEQYIVSLRFGFI